MTVAKVLPLPVLLALLLAAPAHADPATVQAHGRIREVESALQRGQLDAVRLRLQDEARARPGEVMVRVLLAWCLMPSDEAWNQLKGVAAIYPDNPWARLGMGRVYLRWKMREQARTEFDLALKANARFYPARVGLGDLSRAEGNLEQAEAHYRQALALHPDAEAWAGLGHVLLEAGKRDEARAAFTEAVTVWPEQPVVLRELVKLAQAAGDTAAAAQWTEKRLELNPRNAEARLTLAELRLGAGQKAEAVKEFERAMRLGATTPEVVSQVAALYRELEDPEGERRTLEQLAGMDRQAFDHPARLAELAIARGDLQDAEAQLQEAVERAKDRSSLHVRLARLRMMRGQPLEALEAYRAAQAALQDRVPGAQDEAAALSQQLRVGATPVSGSVDRIYGRVAAGLNAFYRERLKASPALAGELTLRVRVDEQGAVRGVDVLKDTVGDPLLAGHAYFALKDAVFPRQKREPVFEFVLQPPKGKR
jgi:tetratricopeptide (TPR) repeat protein